MTETIFAILVVVLIFQYVWWLIDLECLSMKTKKQALILAIPFAFFPLKIIQAFNELD